MLSVLKNNKLRGAIILTVGVIFSQTTFAQVKLTPPANLPPEGYDRLVWVDKRGCRYLKNTSGNGVRWIPQVRINGGHICDPSSAGFVASPTVGTNTGGVPSAPVAAAPSPTPLALSGNQQINELDSLPPRPQSGSSATIAAVPQSSSTNVKLLDDLPPTLLPPEPEATPPAAVATAPSASENSGQLSNLLSGIFGGGRDVATAPVPAPLPVPTLAPTPEPVSIAPEPVSIAPEPVVIAEPAPAPIIIAPEPTPPPVVAAAPTPGTFRIQIGEFADASTAANAKAQLERSGFEAVVENVNGLQRVSAVVPADEARANKALAFIQRYGFANAVLIK